MKVLVMKVKIIATEYARDNISPSNDSLHLFSDWKSTILAVTSQNRENYKSNL